MESKMVLNDLIDSKIFIKNGVSFTQPNEIIGPFLDSINYDNEPIKIKVQNEVVNENVEDHIRNIAYPRFLVEVDRGPDERLPGYSSVMGLLVALDTGKPTMKTYSGQEVMACLNLSIFNASDLHSQDFLKSHQSLFDAAKRFYDNESRQIEQYAAVNYKLINTYLTQEEVNRALGTLLRKANRTGLGTSPIVNAAKLLEDSKSVYYQQGDMQLGNFYNSITQGITDGKDIFSKPEKSLAVAEMLDLMVN